MPEIDFSRRIVLPVAEAGVDVGRHTYTAHSGVDLALDVYRPRAASERLGAVVFVHGGPVPSTMPPPTTWGFFQAYGQLAASVGLVGITFNHRLHAPTDYGTAEGDVRAAMDFVRARAVDFGVDPDRIGVWAFSGGGPLLAWLVRERPAFVRCLLAFYSILDLRPLVEPGHPERADQATRLSPAALLADGSALPPTFVARAGRDTPIVNASVDSFVHAALSANAPLTLVNHPHGHHAFDVLDDSAESRGIIDQAMRFARQHLAPTA